jgi:hypothetical protein
MIARKTLLTPSNAGMAVSFERGFSVSSSLRHFPNIRHHPNIGSAQNASNGCCILQPRRSFDAIQTCNLCSCRYIALRLDAHCVSSNPNRARRVKCRNRQPQRYR